MMKTKKGRTTGSIANPSSPLSLFRSGRLNEITKKFLIGLICAYLAYEYKENAEAWFVAGALVGGLALLAFYLHRNWKRPVSNGRMHLARKA